LSNLAVAGGTDGVGSYNQISFDVPTGTPSHGAIRAYVDRQAVLFSLTYDAAAPNASSFPAFTGYPAGLAHIAYSGSWATPTFTSLPAESPWGFFDSSGNTFIVSPAAHFMTATTSLGPNGAILSGISSQIPSIPQGFQQQALLVIDSGINRAFDTWGQTLTSLQGKTRPANDADITLNRLGYWTDAGAVYYYQTDPSLSYANTLAAVKADFDRQGIALGYMQLDSWFYPKGPAADWQDRADGMYQYTAAPALFGNSLKAFQQIVGVPLVTHARWIDASSPYRSLYRISGNVATDPRYWNDIAAYLGASGVVAYEQDWLANQAQTDFNLTDPDAFLDGMSASMAQQNMTIQYCTPTTRHFLQGSRYSNLTTIRASQDRCEQARWRNFLYASRLAGALGIWPYIDVLMSTEYQNLLVATLSAGPVGVGDQFGKMNTANLLRAVRADGVIVKPDVPLTPTDSSYQSDSRAVDAPLVTSTYTDFGALKAYYLFLFKQGTNPQTTFRLADIGLKTPAYLYDYFADTGHVVNPSDTINESIGGTWMYLVAAPVGPSGIAVLGDRGHFVTLGKKRITGLSDDGTVHLTVAFASRETSRNIEGYSPYEPAVSALVGAVGPLRYDAATQRFRVPVFAEAGGTASIAISRASAAAGQPLQRSGPGAGPPRNGDAR
jgi:hypothetical protein